MHAVFVVALVFGVVSSIIACSKGRNSLGWFLAGLLIGPFALVVAALPLGSGGSIQAVSRLRKSFGQKPLVVVIVI